MANCFYGTGVVKWWPMDRSRSVLITAEGLALAKMEVLTDWRGSNCYVTGASHPTRRHGSESRFPGSNCYGHSLNSGSFGHHYAN